MGDADGNLERCPEDAVIDADTDLEGEGDLLDVGNSSVLAGVHTGVTSPVPVTVGVGLAAALAGSVMPMGG